MLDKAFILCAGMGKRLRPYTDEMPKPMVEIAGQSLVGRALDQLQEAEINEVTINLHYMADVLRAHLHNRLQPEIHFSDEEVLLDTGGGIKKALNNFDDDDPFFVIGGDALWVDAPGQNTLSMMREAFDPDKMDILLLLQDIKTMELTHGVGDYHIGSEGRITRALDQKGTHMFTSLRVHHPRIFEDTPDTPFSYLDLMDRAQENGRLYGIVNTGQWHHISTPAEYEAVRDSVEGLGESVAQEYKDPFDASRKRA